jgi:leucyl/phenylalanyl-tRNA--protein transferase
MADSRDADDLYWVEPRQRAILPLHGFRLSRSLAKRVRSGRYRVTLDQDFHAVLLSCADREETWINPAIEDAMLDLHARCRAHSVEVWDGADLVGGLYGVKLGRAFFGESMFSRRTDASKVALAWLVARLKVGGYALLDCQFMTEHLASLGAISVPRAAYVALLAAAVGTSVRGSGGGGASVVAGASVPVPAAGAERDGVPEFRTLDRLLDEAGAAADSAASGKLITQLLGQTS